MFVCRGGGSAVEEKGANSAGSCHFPVRLLHSSADQSAVCASVWVSLCFC